MSHVHSAPLNGTAAEHGSLMQKTAWAAVGVAAFLIVVKLVAYLMTDSIAMLASLADSALDVFASSVNLIAIRHALTPADPEHRFGHGKAEPLAGLMQSAFIGGSVVFLTIESAGRLIQPHPIEHGMVAIGVMVASIVVTALLVVAQQITVARTKSVAIGADRMHYISDLATNMGVILAIVLATQFDLWIADPIIGLVVAAILRGAPGMSSARATTSSWTANCPRTNARPSNPSSWAMAKCATCTI